MKTLSFTIALLVASCGLFAQDVFQQELFSTELIKKYRQQIELTQDQVDQIEVFQTPKVAEFKRLKEELDRQMSNISKQLANERLNEAQALELMDKISEIEGKLKSIRLAVLVRNKNILTLPQQQKLKDLRTEAEAQADPFQLIPLGEDTKIALKIDKDSKTSPPLYVVIDRKGNKSFPPDLEENLKPEQIESISVLKGESAIKAYGARGKNGVVEVYLKK